MSKGLEALKLVELKDKYTDTEYKLAYKIIEKELKALEIIKRELKICDVENWNLVRWITDEEFDLLKEVLL